MLGWITNKKKLLEKQKLGKLTISNGSVEPQRSLLATSEIED